MRGTDKILARVAKKLRALLGAEDRRAAQRTQVGLHVVEARRAAAAAHPIVELVRVAECRALECRQIRRAGALVAGRARVVVDTAVVGLVHVALRVEVLPGRWRFNWARDRLDVGLAVGAYIDELGLAAG